MKTIKMSQAANIIMIVLMGGKFLLLPSKIAAVSGRDSWLVFFILLFIDFIILLSILYAEKLNGKKLHFNEIMNINFGCFFERIFYVLLFVMFFARVMDTSLNCLTIFSYTMTLRANWVALVVPLFVFAWINLKKGFDNVARVIEFLIIPIILSTVFTIAMSAGDFDISNVRPILANGFKPVAIGIKEHYFWFADMVFMIFLMGKIKPEKRFFSVPLLSFTLGAVLSIGFIVVFLGIFGNAAMFQKYAIAKISQFDVMQISEGRLDWLFLVFWMLSAFLKISVGLYCSLMSLKYLFKAKSRRSENTLIVLMFAAILVIPPVIDYSKVAYEFFGGVGGYFMWLPQALPLILPFLTVRANKKTKVVARPLSSLNGKIERKIKLGM